MNRKELSKTVVHEAQKHVIMINEQKIELDERLYEWQVVEIKDGLKSFSFRISPNSGYEYRIQNTVLIALQEKEAEKKILTLPVENIKTLNKPEWILERIYPDCYRAKIEYIFTDQDVSYGFYEALKTIVDEWNA